MRSGSWSPNPVIAPTATVTVNGTAKAVDSVSVERELPGVLPGQVGSVGGVTAATGDVEWSQPQDVTQRVGTPWTTTDYPSKGQRVGVWAGIGSETYKVFTGYTDGTSGSFGTPSHSTSLVDDIDKLNTSFSMEALARVMPPRSTANDGRRRMIGLLPQYFTDRVLRAAGFYSTPPMDGYCVASAPLVGSTWPERGDLENSYATNDEFGYNRYNPTFAYSSRWGGVGTANVFASYNIDTSVYSGMLTQARPLNITMMVGSTHRTSGYVSASWGDGSRQVRLAVTSTRAVSAQFRDSTNAVTTWLTMTPEEVANAKAVTLRVQLNSTGGTFIVSMRTDMGVLKTTNVTVPDSYLTANPVAQMWVYAPDNRIGGAQVSFTSLEWTAVNYQQTAWLDSPASNVNLEAIPAIQDGNCLDLLKAQSEAECAAFWIDEDGLLFWKNRTEFVNRNVVRTLTAADDLLDVQFRMDGQDVRRKVNVKYRRAAVTTSRSSSIICYEGTKDELEEGDSQDIWIEPDADENWIAVDSTPRTTYGDFNAVLMNSGQGSFYGYTGLNADGDEIPLLNGDGTIPMTFSRITSNTWRYTLTLTKMPTGTVQRLKTASRSDGTAIKPAYRDRGLPLLRCMGKVTWTDQTYTPGVTGPSWAAELEHDVGWFVQDPAEIQALGQWIAGQTADPHPVIESVDIIPDPRLQLGDKVTITDPDRTGVTITGVITAITQSISDGDYTMSLRLLVTEVTAPGVNLTEFDAFYTGMTLAQVDTLKTPMTLTDLDTYPLTD